MDPVPYTRVVLGAPRLDYPGLIARAKTVLNAMSAATTQLPTPSPPLATLTTQLNDLEVAQQNVVDHVPGATAVRQVKAALVLTTLRGMLSYVQSTCDASPALAVQIATAAGMRTYKPTVRTKPVLAVVAGPAGTATLKANRTVLVGKSHGGFFGWQWSVDGKTWTSAPSTAVAQTTIGGLPSLVTVSFRVNVTTSKTVGEWSQAVSVLIH